MIVDKGLMFFRRTQGKYYWEGWKRAIWADWRKVSFKVDWQALWERIKGW